MPKQHSNTTFTGADADHTDGLDAHNADLWAMSYGFKDAADMKAEGERMEREHLANQDQRGAP